MDFDATFSAQPPGLGVILARIDVARGREDLFADQVPELLGSLAEETRIASIRASNAIEGIDVDSRRAEGIARRGLRFRNRNEKEFAGYRDAIDGLLQGSPEPVSVALMLHLHRQIYRHSGGRGGYFKSEDNAIASYESGARVVVFESPGAPQTPFMTQDLIERYLDAQARARAHPLVLLGAFVLDLLAIHPVADGNGRLARLLSTSELLRLGYSVPRYVSIEQEIFESKRSYYASLAESQRGWHESRHSIWPWVSYLAAILASAYESFEARVAVERQPGRISKQARVRRHVLEHAERRFQLRDLRRRLPGISDQTIRLVLNELKSEGHVRVDGTGRGAVWSRLPGLAGGE